MSHLTLLHWHLAGCPEFQNPQKPCRVNGGMGQKINWYPNIYFLLCITHSIFVLSMWALDYGFNINISYCLLASKLVFSFIFGDTSSPGFVLIFSAWGCSTTFQAINFLIQGWDCTMHGFSSKISNCLLFLFEPLSWYRIIN